LSTSMVATQRSPSAASLASSAPATPPAPALLPGALAADVAARLEPSLEGILPIAKLAVPWVKCAFLVSVILNVGVMGRRIVIAILLQLQCFRSGSIGTP
jgi:hypothetical protein